MSLHSKSYCYFRARSPGLLWHHQFVSVKEMLPPRRIIQAPTGHALGVFHCAVFVIVF